MRASDRGHGHSIYVQNVNGNKRIVDNILFDGFSFGIHAYTVERSHRQHRGARQHRVQPRQLVGDRWRQGQHPVRGRSDGAEPDNRRQLRLLPVRQRRSQRGHQRLQQRAVPEQLPGRRHAAPRLPVCQHRGLRQHPVRARGQWDAGHLSQQHLRHDPDRRGRRHPAECLRGRPRQRRDLQLGASTNRQRELVARGASSSATATRFAMPRTTLRQPCFPGSTTDRPSFRWRD